MKLSLVLNPLTKCTTCVTPREYRRVRRHYSRRWPLHSTPCRAPPVLPPVNARPVESHTPIVPSLRRQRDVFQPVSVEVSGSGDIPISAQIARRGTDEGGRCIATKLPKAPLAFRHRRSARPSPSKSRSRQAANPHSTPPVTPPVKLSPVDPDTKGTACCSAKTDPSGHHR